MNPTPMISRIGTGTHCRHRPPKPSIISISFKTAASIPPALPPRRPWGQTCTSSHSLEAAGPIAVSTVGEKICRARPEPSGVRPLPKGMLITAATRWRLGEHLMGRLNCWRSVAVPLVQTALAAGLSWFVAVHLFGHRAPLFAPVAAIVGIDMTLGQRLRRVVGLMVGASAGVGAGALLISAIGTGPWQIAVVVALATSVAVLLDGRAVINVQAAVSAILVATLYVPGETSGIDRLFDGLIGAAIGLVIVAVFARSSVCGPSAAIARTGARGSAS